MSKNRGEKRFNNFRLYKIFFIRCVAGFVFFLGSFSPGYVQDKSSQEHETYAEKAMREEELKAVQDAQKQTTSALKELEDEALKIAQDRTQLNAQLIDTSQKIKSSEIRIQALEQRLEALSSNENAIRKSLEGRRDVIAQVLATLQRMGRRPPPAILAQPEDMLAAVRTSILMGSVLPELREEMETLITDLEDLMQIRNAVDLDRTTLRGELTTFHRNQQRLVTLMEARQNSYNANRQKVQEEQNKAKELAGKAQTLKELIDGMELNVEGARQAAAAARQLTQEVYGTGVNYNAFSDPARLAPKTAFANTKGILPMPVTGRVLHRFGEADRHGGVMRGISLETRPKSVVVSPADGWIAFAGPFRSFGQLLIINAGDGYYLLLAGVEQISVDVGQFVLAGEPIAVMGEKSSLSPALVSVENSDPVLYIEFRKDGGSIDPQPWWTKIQAERIPG